MKIIREGKLPEDKEYTATCRRCGTVFTFTRSEGKFTNDQREGASVQVICPLPKCNALVWVNA